MTTNAGDAFAEPFLKNAVIGKAFFSLAAGALVIPFSIPPLTGNLIAGN